MIMGLCWRRETTGLSQMAFTLFHVKEYNVHWKVLCCVPTLTMLYCYLSYLCHATLLALFGLCLGIFCGLGDC